MNADGGGRRLLASAPWGTPAWSPDGSKIAFSRFNGLGGQVYVTNADGSGTPQNLSNDSSNDDDDPNWSPDGTKIVFARVPPKNFGDSQIWVMNSDGTGPHAVTTPASPPGETGSHYDNQPAWSPDGTQITFNYLNGEPGPAYFQDSVWIVASDGSNLHQASTPGSGANDELPDWQPVGAPASSASFPACSAVGSLTVHAADATGFKSAVNVHYKVDGGAEQVVPVDGAGNAALAVPNGSHSVEYWAGDAAGYQEAAHHTATAKVDTLTGCVKAKVSVAGVRRACVSKAFSIRVRISTKARPKSVKVFLGHKRVLTTRKTSFRLKINPSKLGRRTKLRIVTTDASGNVTTLRRTIARCAVTKPKRQTGPRFTG